MTNLTDYLTPQQAASLLDLAPRMVQRWCQRGKLGQKIGGRYLIHKDEIASFKVTKPKPGRNPNFEKATTLPSHSPPQPRTQRQPRGRR